MSDTPEEKAKRQRLLREITRLSEEAGFYDDESTPDEIVASIKQIRKEMAEERAYYSLDLDKRGVWLDMAIDDFGSARYWMTIEGQEINLLEKEYRVLMEQRVEAYKAAKQEEQERIIKLLEDRLDIARNTQGVITAMQVPVALAAAEAITEALIYTIKGGQE